MRATPVQATLYQLRRVLGGLGSSMDVLLSGTIVPTIDVRDALAVDSGILTVPEGTRQFAYASDITALANQPQVELENPAGSGKVILLDHLSFRNPGAASIPIVLDLGQPAVGNIVARPFSLCSLTPTQVRSIAQVREETAGAAVVAGSRVRHMAVPPGDTRDMHLGRPWPLMPGERLRWWCATAVSTFGYSLVIREFSLPQV